MLCTGWLNYLLLPEVINREWNGQGVIGWAKTRVYEPLKRRCDGKRKSSVSISVVPLQVLNPLILNPLILSCQAHCNASISLQFRWQAEEALPGTL